MPYTPFFEEFWSVYPRRVEKKRCFSVWNARLRDGVEPATMIRAAAAYAADVRKQGTEEPFIKHPSTFIGPSLIFEEWADRPVPKAERPREACDFCEGMGYIMEPDENDWVAVSCPRCEGGWIYGQQSA